MTAVPIPRQPSPNSDRSGQATPDVTPVFALKELVARLNREQHKIQDLLSSLSFALRSFNNLNQFLELIPLIASRVTDADGGALVLFRPNGQVRLERLHCTDSQWSQEVRRAIESATRQVTSGAPSPEDPPGKIAPSIASLDYYLSRHLGEGIQLFSSSILVKNSERGRLYVLSRDPDYSWTEQRQKLVRLVADQTAVAIENDELTSELKKKERLDRELEIGADIQLRLLPRRCPSVTGVKLAALCKTANRVGGDYYDFIPVGPHLTKQEENPGRWSVVIGDVMGKGVPAGLIMTMTRGMLRAEVLNGHTPARILQHLNQVMYADLENSNRFVTLFYSEYDPATRKLYYSNAAHNPPLLWQATTRTVRRLDTFGMLIGLDANTQYQDGSVQLNPGDAVIYYTDGFTEAANSTGDAFDEDNLLKEVSWACEAYNDPQQILDHLFGSVQSFIGPDSSNADDMTLVVMRVQVPGEELVKKAVVESKQTIASGPMTALAEVVAAIESTETPPAIDKPKRTIELPKL